MIGAELVSRRKQFKKAKLSWRTSFGSRKSLGCRAKTGTHATRKQKKARQGDSHKDRQS